MIVEKLSDKGDYGGVQENYDKSKYKIMQTTKIIQKTLGVSGGHACIHNTRIPV
ncbi:MAG: hypothetical protein RLZZ74_3339 [Cyanobacteriota bacterium]